MRRSIFPYEVTMLTRVLSLLPSPRLDDAVISRVEAVAPQCSLGDLNTISFVVAKWVRSDTSYAHSAPSKYVHLLQVLNRCGRERLRTADRLDLLLEELKYISGEWFEEMLVSEAMATLQRMMDQINWTNVPELAFFLTKINQHCPPLLDHIASVAIKDIDKVLQVYTVFLAISCCVSLHRYIFCTPFEDSPLSNVCHAAALLCPELRPPPS